MALVRRFRTPDAEAVATLTVAAYEAYLAGPQDPYLARLRDVATRSSEADVWVAEHEGVLAGTVTWCPLGSPWREIGRDDEGEFRMLAVAPAMQRRGVARVLVEHCFALAREAGMSGMVLSTLTEQAKAHPLYASLGFERAPDRDWSPVPGVDLLAYALRF